MIEHKILCLALIFACLISVIAFDFAYFQIPNTIVLILFVIFFIMNPTFLASHYTWPACILAAGFCLALLNILGFGDSKLLAVLSFGLGDELIIKLLVGTVFAGGVFGIFCFLFKKWIKQIRTSLIENRTIQKFSRYFINNPSKIKSEILDGAYEKYVPYGIPISLTGLYLLSQQLLEHAK